MCLVAVVAIPEAASGFILDRLDFFISDTVPHKQTSALDWQKFLHQTFQLPQGNLDSDECQHWTLGS